MLWSLSYRNTIKKLGKNMRYKERGGFTSFLTYLFFFVLGILATMLFLLGLQPDLEQSIRGTHAMNETLRIIKQNYYKPVETKDLYVTATKAMVDSLDDPYAAFYTGEEYADIRQSQSGSYDGIGISLGQDENGYFFVAYVYPDSSAEKAGLSLEDKLLAVDGEKLDGKTADQVVAMIRGKEKVVLSLQRGEQTWDAELSIEKITIKRVQFKMIDDIAYTHIADFHGDCVAEYEDALKKAKDGQAKGIILDLRNNPGGGLTEVKGIADLFLDEGVLMSMRSRNGDEIFENTSKGIETDLPVVMIINENSASASEVLAGAMQDRDRAIIVGTRSYGKGIVQSIIPIVFDDSYVKLTTSTYYTPNGRSIHEQGIDPDIEIDLPAKLKSKALDELTEKEDIQLQKAIACLNEEIAKQ